MALACDNSFFSRSFAKIFQRHVFCTRGAECRAVCTVLFSRMCKRCGLYGAGYTGSATKNLCADMAIPSLARLRGHESLCDAAHMVLSYPHIRQRNSCRICHCDWNAGDWTNYGYTDSNLRWGMCSWTFISHELRAKLFGFSNRNWKFRAQRDELQDDPCKVVPGKIQSNVVVYPNFSASPGSILTPNWQYPCKKKRKNVPMHLRN